MATIVLFHGIAHEQLSSGGDREGEESAGINRHEERDENPI